MTTSSTLKLPISSADGLIGEKFGLWLVLPIILLPIEAQKSSRSGRTTQNLHSGYSKWYISAADGPIGLKFGLWLVLPIILVPEVKKNHARSAATTPNKESTLTLALLRRPLFRACLMVSGHFLLSH